MKRLVTITWAMALILSAATLLHAQTATPATSDDPAWHSHHRIRRLDRPGSARHGDSNDFSSDAGAPRTRGATGERCEDRSSHSGAESRSRNRREIKTSGYSVQPQRMYRENQPPTITGYEARNTVTVTMSDLTKVGTLIDASSQPAQTTSRVSRSRCGRTARRVIVLWAKRRAKRCTKPK